MSKPYDYEVIFSWVKGSTRIFTQTFNHHCKHYNTRSSVYSEKITYEEVDFTCVKDDIEKVLFEGLKYEQPCSGDDSLFRYCREIGDC